MFYKAPTVASGRTTTYPYTLIRIDHDAVVLTGNKVAISLKYSVAGGATTYNVASGVVVDVITLASVKYITLNLGWKFTRTDLTGAVYDAGCVPTYTLYPAVPSGLTFPAYVTTLYSQRIWVMMFGTGDSAKQGGGAQLTNAANQVSGTNTTTSFKAKRTNTGVALPTAPNSNDDWLYVASIPTELTSATITADGHEPFTADHVGMLIGLTDPLKDQCVTKEQTAATTNAAPAYSATILTTGSITMTTFNSWKGTVHLVKSIDDGVTWEICGSVASPTLNAFNGTLTREAGSKPTLFKARIIHTSGTCNVTLTADSAITHIAEIVAYIDPQHVAARMQSGTTYKFSTHLWYIGQFGKPVGYAQATSFFQQRRVLACTEKSTNVIWMSRTGEYDNFAVSSMQLATEPVTLKASATEMEDIRHVIALRSLLVLSSGGWYSLGTDADGLTPTNGTIVRQGYSGFAQYIRPEIFGMSVVALGDDLRTISEIRYSLAADGYDRADLNVLSRHLFAGKKVVGWAKQENPNYLLWTILDDGTGAILTFLKDQEVFAWTRFDTDGEIMQISSNKSPTQDDDEVYMLVKRAIGGVDKYYIEYIGERLPGSVRKEGVFVDSAIRYSGAAATTISGLKHLAGKAVSVLADGLVVEGKTVSNAGTITLTTAASVVHVGLPYTSEIETLNIELQEGTTSQGRKKAVRKVVVRVTDSAGFTIGPDRGRQTRPAQWDDLLGDDLFNGDIDHRIKGDWDQDGGLVIQQTQPLPMTVQCIIPFIDRGE
jgi:hypothetical protein